MANRQIKLSPLAQENGNLVDDNLSNNRRFRNIIRDGKGNSTLINQTAEQVAIKANQSTVDEINTRLNSAEQKSHLLRLRKLLEVQPNT